MLWTLGWNISTCITHNTGQINKVQPERKKEKKQAGAELCQAQDQLGLIRQQTVFKYWLKGLNSLHGLNGSNGLNCFKQLESFEWALMLQFF